MFSPVRRTRATRAWLRVAFPFKLDRPIMEIFPHLPSGAPGGSVMCGKPPARLRRRDPAQARRKAPLGPSLIKPARVRSDQPLEPKGMPVACAILEWVTTRAHGRLSSPSETAMTLASLALSLGGLHLTTLAHLAAAGLTSATSARVLFGRAAALPITAQGNEHGQVVQSRFARQGTKSLEQIPPWLAWFFRRNTDFDNL